VPESNVALPARPSTSAGNLSDRVQSLRLPPAQRSGGASGLAWLLVAVFAVLSTYLALGGVLPFVPRLLVTSAENATDTTRAVAPTEGTTSSTTGTTVSTEANSTAASTSQIVLESKGWVIPEQQILVSPQVSGRILELNFEAGQRVTKGEVLAVLDSTEYRSEHERALAEVASARERMNEAAVGNRPDEIKQAQAELEEAKTQLAQAERTLKRRQELFDQKAITSQDIEDSQSQYDALLRRVEKLSAASRLMSEGPRSERKRISEAELRRAEAELSRAKWRLDNTIITAPISGTILKKNAELGNLVNPIAFNGSFSLCDIADLAKLEVELSIQERDISKVFQYQKCRVRSEAFPERIYEGYVSRLMPIADRAKSAIPVRVRVSVPSEEQGAYLKPEMGATVTFFQDKVDPPATIRTTTTSAQQ
jgi:HlyD family secretion protein